MTKHFTDDELNILTLYYDLIKKPCERCDDNKLIEVTDKLNLDIHSFSEFALRLSARYGRLELVKHLVKKHKCDPSVFNWDILNDALDCGHIEVAKYIVELARAKGVFRVK